jgi:hypothetical protein
MGQPGTPQTLFVACNTIFDGTQMGVGGHARDSFATVPNKVFYGHLGSRPVFYFD